VRRVAAALLRLALGGCQAQVIASRALGSAQQNVAVSGLGRPSANDAKVASFAEVLGAIDSATTVVATAYTLSPRSRFTRALERAQQRGAHVSVVLTGSGMPYAVTANRALAASSGMHVVLTRNVPLHLKAVVVDHGAAVYVSDRNWTPRRSLILQLPGGFARTVERAALGDPHDALPLTTTKRSSLREEALVIARARSRVYLETESFGDANPVYDALVSARRRGADVSILIATSEYSRSLAEQRVVSKLLALGVHCGQSTSDQKLLEVDGRSGWLGSSNATAGVADQVDWGFTTSSPGLVRVIASALSADARGRSE